jgi:hypothetical protein
MSSPCIFWFIDLPHYHHCRPSIQREPDAIQVGFFPFPRNYVNLSKSGVKVSRLCLGAMSNGLPGAMRFDLCETPTSEEQITRAPPAKVRHGD